MMKGYRDILRKNRNMLTGIGFVMVISAIFAVAAGYSLSWILNAYEAQGDRVRQLILASLGSVGMFGLCILTEYLGDLSLAWMQRRIKNDLRKMASRKLASLSYEEFYQKDSGAYVSWLGNDVDQLYTNAFEQLFQGIRRGFSALFAFVVMSMSSWYLGVAALILFVIQFTVPQLMNKAMERATQRRSQAMEQSVEAYKDTIMGTGIFYLSNLRQKIVERIAVSSDKAEQQIFLSNRTVCTVQNLLSLVSCNNQIVLTLVATFAAITGAAPIGIIFAVGNLCGQFFNGIGDAVKAVVSIRSTKPLWEKFELSVVKNEGAEINKPIDEITMQNLSFAYGEKQILTERDFSFVSGGKYAVCGESGSGKTTVMKLLLGLLPRYEGRICYDGIEQRQADVSSLYEQIGYVDQQVYLFQDSLRFNITLGQHYSEQEIWSVIKACRLQELVNSLPNGLDSIILENGKNLSGGQRQRIALARGLIRKVRYMVLDEGTSALDEENALDIEQNLMNRKELCVIVITHNLRDSIRKQLTRVYEI